MLSNFYEYFFGDDKPIEYKERLKYLTTVSRYELVESSLPVFVAAGVSGSASAIIGVLSEEKEDIELVLKLLYTLFAYFVGKALTYRLLVDEDRNSTTFPFPLLREYKFSKLSRHSLSELSGFAWKEFAIAFCLEEIFLKEGLGAAFGSWLLIVFSAIAFVTVSSHIQRKIFRLDHTWNHKVLSYDTDAFALSIAYVLTAAVALGLWELGVGLAPSSSILFEWDEGFEEDHEGGTDIVYLYAIIIACVVAVMQFSEDEEGGQQSDELCEVSAPVTATPVIRPSTAPSALQQAAAAAETINPIATSNHSSFELDRGSGNSAPTPAHLLSPPGAQAEEGAVWFFVFDHDSVVTLKGVWNEFLGYLAGIGYLLLILALVDFNSPYKIIPALIVALLAAYRGPSIIAKLRITTEEAEAKKAAAAAALEAGDISSSNSNSNEENNCCTHRVHALYALFSDVNLKRKSVSMVSIRLTVGWLWEIVVQDAFSMVGRTSTLEPYQAALAEVLFATGIIAIVLCVHLYVRDWASDALIAEDARTLNANREAQPVRGSEEGSASRRADTSQGHGSTITI